MPGIRSLNSKIDPILQDTLDRAYRVAREGRHGDTMLAHLRPEQADMLKRMGGAGTRNPKTGLREYYSADTDGGPDSAPGGHGPGGGGPSGNDNDRGGGFEGTSFSGGGGIDLGGTSPSYGGGALGGGVGLGRNGGSYSGSGQRGGSPNDGRFSSPDIAQRELSSIAKYGTNYDNLDAIQRADIALSGFLGRNIGNPTQSAAKMGINAALGAVPVVGALNTLGGLFGYSVGDMMTEDMEPGAIGNGITGTAGSLDQGMGAAGMSGERGSSDRNDGDRETGGITSLKAEDSGKTDGADEGKDEKETKSLDYLPANWDEGSFLATHPAVKAAVEAGIWRTGYDFNKAHKNVHGDDYRGGNTPLLDTRPGQAVFPGGY